LAEHNAALKGVMIGNGSQGRERADRYSMNMAAARAYRGV